MAGNKKGSKMMAGRRGSNEEDKKEGRSSRASKVGER
jgi:hypothetical protein